MKLISKDGQRGSTTTESNNKDLHGRAQYLVLYVEDEETNRDVAKLRLSRSYQLLCAQNVVDACQIIRERGKELLAILMDIQLKGSELNGIQLTKLLRGKLSKAETPGYASAIPVLQTPIIFVTAYGSRYSESELLAAGGNLVIHKPVDYIQLMLALAKISLAPVKDPGANQPSTGS